MQKLLDEKDARIIELEAQLGDPLALWWQQVTDGQFGGGGSSGQDDKKVAKKVAETLSVSQIRALKAAQNKQ